MSTSVSDSELIKKYKKTQDPAYVGTLYAPYMPLVYGVCLKYLKNRVLAQDAVMDLFEKLTVELLKHDTPLNFKTWLFVVTKNYCLMYLRKEGSDNKAFKYMATEFMEHESFVHPLDEIEKPDLDDRLKACIEKLKEQQRQAIENFYFDKMCYKEIADKLKVDEKKVKSDIQNGKRNLILCMEEKHEA
jgi:RNA polymerase sigma-70 factor (ECF subfamily)